MSDVSGCSHDHWLWARSCAVAIWTDTSAMALPNNTFCAGIGFKSGSPHGNVLFRIIVRKHLLQAMENELHGGPRCNHRHRPSKIRPMMMAMNIGSRRSKNGSSRMSMGGPQTHPSAMQAAVKAAHPAKSSQNIGTGYARMVKTRATHAIGQLGPRQTGCPVDREDSSMRRRSSGDTIFRGGSSSPSLSSSPSSSSVSETSGSARATGAMSGGSGVK